jgi:hypothetical protein
VPLIAVTVSLVVHGLWALLPFPQLEPVSYIPPPPLRAIPNLDTHVWSPTLFSLPSPVGFSAVLKSMPEPAPAPLQSPLQLLSAYVLDLNGLFPTNGLPPLSSGRPPLAAVFPPARPAPSLTARSWELRSHAGAELPVQLTRLLPAPPDGRTLVLTGSLRFDRTGQVETLRLDPPAPAPPEFARDLAAALRRSRLPRGMGPADYVFRLAYVQPEAQP